MTRLLTNVAEPAENRPLIWFRVCSNAEIGRVPLAANRDEHHFSEPDRFDVRRWQARVVRPFIRPCVNRQKLHANAEPTRLRSKSVNDIERLPCRVPLSARLNRALADPGGRV